MCRISFLIWDPFLLSFLIFCLPTPNGFLKTSIFLKTQMSPFFFPPPTKTGNTRCEISLLAPLHSTHPPHCLGGFILACHLRGVPPPFVCCGASLLPHPDAPPGPQSLSQRVVCLRTFLPRLWIKSSFPSLHQPSWRKISGQRENECTGKKGGKKGERKTWHGYLVPLYQM